LSLNNLHAKHNFISAKLLAILCLTLSVLFCTTGTVAWLSRNRWVQSQDMTLHAETSANLVIAKSSAAVCAGDILTSASNPFAVSLNQDTTGLTAATHDSSYATGLKYIANTEFLGRITGKMTDGTAIQWAIAAENSQYISYKFYIAAAGGDLSNVDLTVSIVDPAAGATVNNTYKSLSADVYADLDAGDGVTPAYLGTLNVAGLSYTNNGAAATSINLLSDGTVYQNTKNRYISIELRVYFDGNLQIPAGQSGAGNTYLTAANLDTNNKTLGLLFSATAHQN